MGDVVHLDVREAGNRRAGDVKIVDVFFDADARIPNRLGRRERRARACKRIEDDAASQWKHGAHELTEECLGLEARVRSQFSF